MKWCDITPSVEEWGSEEIIIPYTSPVDGNDIDTFQTSMSNGKKST